MSMNILSISNTKQGKFDKKLNEFTAEEYRGDTVYSNNRFKVKTDTASEFPAMLSAGQITELVAFAKSSGIDLNTDDGDYELSRRAEHPERTEGVIKPACIIWYYKPVQVPLGKFNFSK